MAKRFRVWLVAVLVPFSALCQQSGTTETDCLSEQSLRQHKTQYFACLNSKREYVQDTLLMAQAECGVDSEKYRGLYTKYLDLRMAANQMLDIIITDLKYRTKTKAPEVKQRLTDVNAKARAFDAYFQMTTCDGGSTRILPLLVPIISAVLLDKAEEMLRGWLSGNREQKMQWAEDLNQQRWKSPVDFGAQPPAAAARTPQASGSTP